MQQTQLIDYLTEGILDYLKRRPKPIPSHAACEVAQMSLLREYVALHQTPDQELSTLQPFDAYEVNPVLETNGVECEAFHTLDEACEALAKAEYDGTPARILWTIYGHIPNSGVQVIADCESEEEAFSQLYTIAGIRGIPGKTHYLVLT